MADPVTRVEMYSIMLADYRRLLTTVTTAGNGKILGMVDGK